MSEPMIIRKLKTAFLAREDPVELLDSLQSPVAAPIAQSYYKQLP